MGEKEIDDQIAALIASADQMAASLRGIADGHATFYKELVAQGLPDEVALHLTITQLQSFWQYLTVSHNTPDVEGKN